MKPRRLNKRSSLLALTLLIVGITLPCILWIRKEQSQYALNRQLIEALKKSDTRAALILVNAGADPNTRLDPPVFALPQLINRLIRGSPPRITALMIVCGAVWYDETLKENRKIEASNLYLMQAIIRHGANLSAKDDTGMTALHYAVVDQNKAIVSQLLVYGADPNQPDERGRTAFDLADSLYQPDIVALLRQYSKFP